MLFSFKSLNRPVETRQTKAETVGFIYSQLSSSLVTWTVLLIIK